MTYALCRVDARGLRRRLQALQALGWSTANIGRQMGVAQQRAHQLLYIEWVVPATFERVNVLYERLWDQRPSMVSRKERESATKALNNARRHRWVPPLAWDDIDVDERPPAAERIPRDVDEIAVELACSGEPVRLTVAERRAAITLLHSRQMSDADIAETLRMASRQVLRIRNHELKLPAIPSKYSSTKERLAS